MASGSDAAMHAAQLVLLESDFSKMPGVVRQGRQVVNNLERSGSLFLVKNVFSFTTSLIAILMAIKYPLLPTQISLISMFTIGIPGFLLSQLPNTDLIKGSFTYNILSRAVPGGITDMIIVALMMVIGTIFNLPGEEISTASTILLAVVGMAMVYRASKPMNRIKWGIFFLMIVGLVLCSIFLPWLFGMSPLSIQTIIICIGLSLASFPILQKLTEICDRFGVRIRRLIDKYSSRVKSLLKEMWADR